MPFYEKGDVRIHYEEAGSGFPLLVIPGGGLNSTVAGLATHPFNPVVRMELVELCVTDAARAGIAERAKAWCEALGKTVVEVPDQPGFVVEVMNP